MAQEPHGEPAQRVPAAPTDPADRAAATERSVMQTFAAVGGVGLSFVLAIAMGTALGLWLDHVTGWSPAFFIFFFLCGLAAGIVNLYRSISNLPK